MGVLLMTFSATLLFPLKIKLLLRTPGKAVFLNLTVYSSLSSCCLPEALFVVSVDVAFLPPRLCPQASFCDSKSSSNVWLPIFPDFYLQPRSVS